MQDKSHTFLLMKHKIIFITSLVSPFFYMIILDVINLEVLFPLGLISFGIAFWASEKMFNQEVLLIKENRI